MSDTPRPEQLKKELAIEGLSDAWKIEHLCILAHNLNRRLAFTNKVIADALEYTEEHEEIFGDEGLREILTRKEIG